MSKVVAKIFGFGGENAQFTEEEMKFFCTNIGLEKIWRGLYILKRLIANKSLNGLKIFLKGAFNSVILRYRFPLSSNEYNSMLNEIIGFIPSRAELKFDDVVLKIDNVNLQSALFALYGQVVLLNQYCISRGNVRGKIVIDAGANIGFFSLYAAKLGARRIYAFEPVKDTYANLKKNISKNGYGGVCIPINKALGDKNKKGKIYFAQCSDAEASICFHKENSKSQPIDIVSIDSFMKNKGRIDFIKIDTEGYEKNILVGAKKTIARYKPILCFSAYHKKEDKVCLPKLVKKIRSDYSCTLQSFGEEDFYCK